MTSGIPTAEIRWHLPNSQVIRQPDATSINVKAMHGVLSIHSLELVVIYWLHQLTKYVVNGLSRICHPKVGNVSFKFHNNKAPLIHRQ